MGQVKAGGGPPTTWNIDLSSVYKQTELVGVDGWMLVEHSILVTDVLPKFNIFLLKYLPMIGCFVSNKFNTANICRTKISHFWGVVGVNSFPTPVCKSFGCDNAKERSIIKDDDKWNGDLFLLAKCGILALATLVNYFYDLGMYHLGVHKMRFVQSLIWWNCHRFLLTSRIYYSKCQDHDTPPKQI